MVFILLPKHEAQKTKSPACEYATRPGGEELHIPRLMISIAAEDEEADAQGRDMDLEAVSPEDPRVATNPVFKSRETTPPIIHMREDRAWWKAKSEYSVIPHVSKVLMVAYTRICCITIARGSCRRVIQAPRQIKPATFEQQETQVCRGRRGG